LTSSQSSAFSRPTRKSSFTTPRLCIQSVNPSKVARINALSPIWHLNDIEAQAYTGLANLQNAGEKILAECHNAVVITQGAAGAHLFCAEGHALIPSQPVKPVDAVVTSLLTG